MASSCLGSEQQVSLIAGISCLWEKTQIKLKYQGLWDLPWLMICHLLPYRVLGKLFIHAVVLGEELVPGFSWTSPCLYFVSFESVYKNFIHEYIVFLILVTTSTHTCFPRGDLGTFVMSTLSWFYKRSMFEKIAFSWVLISTFSIA